LFPAARWKAYLHNLQDNAVGDGGDEQDKNIYRIFHSQKLWFTRDENNGHDSAAREQLERCDALLKECSTMVDDLEETLANTPKPSEVMDWFW
jgi:hypothetical protein